MLLLKGMFFFLQSPIHNAQGDTVLIKGLFLTVVLARSLKITDTVDLVLSQKFTITVDLIATKCFNVVYSASVDITTATYCSLTFTFLVHIHKLYLFLERHNLYLAFMFNARSLRKCVVFEWHLRSSRMNC